MMLVESLPASYLLEIMVLEGHRVARTEGGGVLTSPPLDLSFVAPEKLRLIAASTFSTKHHIAMCSQCGREALRSGGKKRCSLTPRCEGTLQRPTSEAVAELWAFIKKAEGPLPKQQRSGPSGAV